MNNIFALMFICTLTSSACALDLLREAIGPLGVAKPAIDPFYSPPSDFAKYKVGQIIKSRSAPVPPFNLSNVEHSYQIMYRTTDTFDDASYTIGTVIVPKNNRDATKLVAYQVAEDSAYINCCPSYTIMSAYDQVMDHLLDYGYYLLVPDYEGPKSAFTAGYVAGYGVLDGIRAALQSKSLTGLSSDANVTLWGYSGGSLASGWAAQLQPTYAPDLTGIIGCAVGGFVTNVTAVALNANGRLDAGFFVAGLNGLANEYPSLMSAIKAHMYWWVQPYFFSAKTMCTTQVLLDFLYRNVFDFIDDGSAFMSLPGVSSVIETLNLGMNGQKPEIPMFVYQSMIDEVVPYKIVDKTVAEWCAAGAQVQYRIDTGASHLEEATNVMPQAINWIVDRFNGVEVASGCTYDNMTTST